MFYAGVGWSDHGYRVAVLNHYKNDHSTIAVGADTSEVDHLIELLERSLDPRDDRLACFVDTSTGALAGVLTDANLEVYRLDPPLLGSVPADPRELARIGSEAFDRAVRLDPEGGFLRGRIDELVGLCSSCADLEGELARAGRFLAHGDRTRRDVALTFDDGPHPPYTGGVLDILRDFAVPGTFFCIGLAVKAYPEIVSRARSEGHCVGSHTWSHPYLPDLAEDKLEFQVRATGAALGHVTGQQSTLFRPPYGARSPQIERKLQMLDQVVVTWDVDSWDWARPGTRSIVDRVLADAGDGSVILLHDGGGDRSQTVAALPPIIEGLLDRGQTPVTVESLLASEPWQVDSPPAGSPPKSPDDRR
jgi:peptidoglycan/xylan/chitin deacetylase (PgdA/CDA1 family)